MMTVYKEKRKEKGSVILEASIFIPLFILIILFVYGLFFVTSAQNRIGHALMQSAKSLSLDPYLTEHVDSVQESETFWSSLGGMIMDKVRLSNDQYFSSASDWYKSHVKSGGTPEEQEIQAATDAAAVNNVVIKRFIGFLADGDEVAANELLCNLGVIDGLDGLGMTASIEDDDLTISLVYTLQFWFDAFDLGKIPMKQSITIHLLT